MWMQSIAVGYLQYERIVYVFLTRICIFHSTRMNLRAMILRGTAGRICHLENVKSYMSYLPFDCKLKKFGEMLLTTLEHN
jgi:hypothetical protein